MQLVWASLHHIVRVAMNRNAQGLCSTISLPTYWPPSSLWVAVYGALISSTTIFLYYSPAQQAPDAKHHLLLQAIASSTMSRTS